MNQFDVGHITDSTATDRLDVVGSNLPLGLGSADIIQIGILLVIAIQTALILWDLWRDHRNHRRQATFAEIQTLREQVFSDAHGFEERHGRYFLLDPSTMNDEEKKAARKILSAFEQFSTGINLGFFDIVVFERTVGSLFCRNIEGFEEFISSQQDETSDKRLWEENLEVYKSHFGPDWLKQSALK